MGKIISLFILLVASTGLAYVVRNQNLTETMYLLFWIWFVYSGIHYVITDWQITQYKWFKNRQALLYLLFIGIIALIVIGFHLIFKN